MPGNPEDEEPEEGDPQEPTQPDSHDEEPETAEEATDEEEEVTEDESAETETRPFDDPDQAPTADLTESWTDGVPPQYRTDDDDEAEAAMGDESEDEPADDDEPAVDEAGDEDEGSDDEEESADDSDEEADDEAESDEDAESPEDEDSEAVEEDPDESGQAGEDGESESEEESDESESDEEEEDAEEADAEEEDEDGDDDEESEEDDDMVEYHDDTTPLERKTGPESDTEQPLADHIEEMIRRLAVVVVVAGLVSLAAFPFGEDFIVFLWYSVLPADVSQPHVYHPLELVITQLKAASLLGLILALPVFVYETYAFMRPGLYPHERRYYLAAVPTSLVLASIGLLFGYFLVLPTVMTYFLYYSRDVVDIAFALGQTFNLMLILLGYLALVFQIPLFIMLAIMMGLTTRTWLEGRRLIFWGAFLGISFLFSPDPTGMAPILVAATMIALFEGTLLLLRWTNRGG